LRCCGEALAPAALGGALAGRARRVRPALRRSARALLHLEDRALWRGEDPLRGRGRRSRRRHRQDAPGHEAGNRDPHRLPDALAGRQVARLRRAHRGRQPDLELPHPVQQDHHDLVLPGAREEDEDQAGGVQPGRETDLATGSAAVLSGPELAALLDRHGFDFYTGVPCSLVEDLIVALEDDRPAPWIPAVREDVAVGLAAGAWLGGRRPAVIMQNSGLGTSLNAPASPSLLYALPPRLIVTSPG